MAEKRRKKSWIPYLVRFSMRKSSKTAGALSRDITIGCQDPEDTHEKMVNVRLTEVECQACLNSSLCVRIHDDTSGEEWNVCLDCMNELLASGQEIIKSLRRTESKLAKTAAEKNPFAEEIKEGEEG